MIPQNKYIIFQVPSNQRDLTRPRYPSVHRKCKFISGNYNKRLVCDILLYNGVQAGVSERDRKVSIYWGTCLEISNQQITQYGNSSNNTYNNHNINPIFNGANNYSGNIENINMLYKYNHFPNSKFFLGNKAEFAYIIQKNPAYDSFPHILPYTYILPRDRDALFKAMRSHPSTCFIAKPPSGSCGNGIKLVTYSDFYYISPNSVVSEYIARPLCIDGFKFDLRVYVLVTSYCPLRAFVAKEGLTRFATESYSSSSANIYSHLTNATLNKKSRHWENGAFKWKMTELIQEVAYRWSNQNNKSNYNGHDGREIQKNAQNQLMDKILSAIAMTLAFVQPTMCPKERKRLLDPCFELYGFDLIFDRNFRPYVLEVNTMPSLNTDEDVDYEVKAPLLAQAFSIAGIPDMTNDQLQEIVKNFKLPPGGVQQFDAEITKQEDERNRLSGEGFIRIFPSEKYSAKYSHLLVEPKLHSKLLSQQEEQKQQVQQMQPKQQPQHFVAKEVPSHENKVEIKPSNPSSSNSEENFSKSSKPSNPIENSTTIKKVHKATVNSLQKHQMKSKTLPSLAITSPPSTKPSTSNASRIKVTSKQTQKSGTLEHPQTATNNVRSLHSNRRPIEDTKSRPLSSSSSTSLPTSLLSQEVGAAVLALYLSKIEMKLKATGDPRLAARAQCFLVAQGYRVARGVSGVRALLSHYSGQVRQWSIANSNEQPNNNSNVNNAARMAPIPEKIKHELIQGDDEAFKKILTSCELPMNVKNIRLLFK